MNKSEITLIVPPVELQYCNIINSSSLLTNVKKYPALGLGYVAAVLEKDEYPIRYIDMFALDMTYKSLKTQLEKAPPNYVGITADIATIMPARKIAKIIRKINPECKIIIGGVQVELFPHETIQHAEFDVGVIGEGEYTMLELMPKLEKRESINDVKGIIFKKDGKIIKTPPRPFIKDLDILPFPARHLMPLKRYCSDVSKNRYITTIASSRGCPFNCLFCIKNPPWRGRSPKNVVDELESIKNDFGIEEVLFVDSTFSVNKNRVIEICKEIIRRKLKIIWECSTRADCVNEKLLLWMKRAGCERIQYGIESGDPRILKIIRKNISLNQIEQAILWAKKANLEILTLFMIGCPGDTIQSMNRTINFAKKLDTDFTFFGIATPGPGSDMLDLAIEQGIVEPDIWTKFVKGETTDIPTPNFESEEFDREKLIQLLRKAYLTFYFRPKYILKRLLKIKSFSEFKNNLNGFRNLVVEIFYSYFM